MARPRSWTDEQLREAVATSETLTEVLAKLGLSRGGGTLAAVRKRIVALGLESPHERWRERSPEWHADPSKLYTTNPVGRRSWSDRDLARAVYASRSIAGVLRQLGLASQLRERLLTEGVKQRRCELCRLTEWRSRPIPLQLDHVNGDRRDNRLANLRLLCPNCHAQTDTWCGKNIGRGGV